MNTHLWRGALVIGCLMVAATAFGQAKIRCESQDGRYHECPGFRFWRGAVFHPA